MFFILSITGKHYFIIKVYWRFSTAILSASFEKSVLIRVRVLHYLHSNSTILMPKLKKTTVYYTCKNLLHTFVGYDYRTQCTALIFEEKTFQFEKMGNGTCLGVVNK